MIKAIIFDFDGTLADTLPFYVKTYRIALEQIGFQYKTDKEIVSRCFGKKTDEVCTKLGVPEKTKLFEESYFSAIKKEFKYASLFPDTLSTLSFLRKKGIKIVINTFAVRWYLDMAVNQFNLASQIDLLISRDDITSPKPHPEAILKTCKHFSLKPEEIMAVGDTESDILMAKAAGSKSVLFFPDEYNQFYDFAELKKTKPDFTIKK